MNDMLQEILGKTFIIPISNAEIEIIRKIANIFMDDMEVEQLQLCGEVYFERARIREFQKQLETISTDEKLEMPQLPILAYVGLAEFIFCSVVQDEDQPDDFRFIVSLYIRNYLVCHKYEDQLLCPKLLIETLEFANDYLKRNIAPANVVSTFKPAIFKANNWKDLLGESASVSQEHFQEIKQFAMKAEKYDFEQAKILIAKSQNKDEFQKAFDAAYKLAHVSQWIKVDATPKETIKTIIRKSAIQKKLCAINIDLSSYEVDDIQSDSSILLRYLLGKGDKDERIGEAKFSPTEFAVYLYYEFLLEKFLVEYGN